MTKENLFRMMVETADTYYNGWLDGLEYTLWAEIQESKTAKETHVSQVTLMRLLEVAQMSNGWWLWTSDEPRFVSLEVWTSLYNKRVTILQ